LGDLLQGVQIEVLRANAEAGRPSFIKSLKDDPRGFLSRFEGIIIGGSPDGQGLGVTRAMNAFSRFTENGGAMIFLHNAIGWKGWGTVAQTLGFQKRPKSEIGPDYPVGRASQATFTRQLPPTDPLRLDLPETIDISRTCHNVRWDVSAHEPVVAELARTENSKDIRFLTVRGRIATVEIGHDREGELHTEHEKILLRNLLRGLPQRPDIVRLPLVQT
jgi:hypothetical protein